MSDATTREWITAKKAAEILEVGHTHVRRLAGEGLIGVQAIPGRSQRYLRADVLRLKADATRPATRHLAGPDAGSRQAQP